MPAVGDPRHLPLAEALHALAAGQRTGRLVVGTGEWQAEIYVGEGQWLTAAPIGATLPLAHYLIGDGLLSQEHFQAATGVPLADAGSVSDMQTARLLISARCFSQEQLRTWATHDAVDLLTKLLSIPGIEFAFEDGAALPAGRFALPLPLQPLLAQLTGALNGRQTAIREAKPLPRFAVLDCAEVEPASGQFIQLTREQWQVLTRVDAQTPLWQIARSLDFPEPMVLRMAGELAAAGVVYVIDAALPGDPEYAAE